MPSWAGAMIALPEPGESFPAPALPPALSSHSRTATLEWGCPVSDSVKSDSQAEAVQTIRSECIEEVSRAAARKPGVMNVIDIRIVWPDIQDEQTQAGFHLQGTFFLETVVLQRTTPGDR